MSVLLQIKLPCNPPHSTITPSSLTRLLRHSHHSNTKMQTRSQTAKALFIESMKTKPSITKKSCSKLNKTKTLNASKRSQSASPASGLKRILIFPDTNFTASFVSITECKKHFVAPSDRRCVQTIALADGTFAQLYTETNTTDLIYNNAATTIAHDPKYAQNDFDVVSTAVRKWIAKTGCEWCTHSSCKNDENCDARSEKIMEALIHGIAMIKRVDEDGDELGMTNDSFLEIWDTRYVSLRRTLEE